MNTRWVLTRLSFGIVLVVLVLSLGGCSSAPRRPRVIVRDWPIEPPEPEPPPLRFRPRPEPEPARDCASSFDPCTCDLAEFPIPLLDQRLERPGDTRVEREETAINLRATANSLKNQYWQSLELPLGVSALRFYEGFLTLASPDDKTASFVLLHSISIYCEFGCDDKAKELADELRYGYLYEPDDLRKALDYCRER